MGLERFLEWLKKDLIFLNTYFATPRPRPTAEERALLNRC